MRKRWSRSDNSPPGCAHDFNNILTIIQGHADRFARQGDNHHDITEPLKQVSAARPARLQPDSPIADVQIRKQVMQPGCSI